MVLDGPGVRVLIDNYGLGTGWGTSQGGRSTGPGKHVVRGKIPLRFLGEDGRWEPMPAEECFAEARRIEAAYDGPMPRDVKARWNRMIAAKGEKRIESTNELLNRAARITPKDLTENSWYHGELARVTAELEARLRAWEKAKEPTV